MCTRSQCIKKAGYNVHCVKSICQGELHYVAISSGSTERKAISVIVAGILCMKENAILQTHHVKSICLG